VALSLEEIARIEASGREAIENAFRKRRDERQDGHSSTRSTARIESFSADWRSALARDGKKIIPDERNVILALRLAPEFRSMLRLNDHALRVELAAAPPWRHAVPGEPWLDEDDIALKALLQSWEIQVRQTGTVADSVHLVARDTIVHPVRDFLGLLTWDGTQRLSTWPVEYLKAEGPAAYLAAIGRRFLISAVARIYQPGCQVDHVLVLEGPQGGGKSSTARILGIRPDWFTDGMPDFHSKDAALQMSGRWLVELAELAAMRRSEVEVVKAFVSRPVDVFRPPYARRAVAVPRQCVFLATTNETTYLRDPTGNRRFWPIRCGRIDLDGLLRDREQLWAEAVAAYRAGERWHLDRDEAELAKGEQEERVLVTELESTVSEYLERMRLTGQCEIDVRSVLIYALRLDPDSSDFSERAVRLGAQVAAAMERESWHKLKRSGRGANRRTMYVYQESPR
jgi:predicted P-loop ATPase